jgi:hypothetical protein
MEHAWEIQKNVIKPERKIPLGSFRCRFEEWIL